MKLFYIFLAFFISPLYSQDLVGMDADISNLAQVITVTLDENTLDGFDLNQTLNDRPILLCPSAQFREDEYYFRIIGIDILLEEWINFFYTF